MRSNSIFIHIPKTGGITVEKTLDLYVARSTDTYIDVVNKHKEGHISIGHMSYTILSIAGLIPIEFQNVFKFCFCRNPYDRAVSLYAYETTIKKLTFLEFTKERLGKYFASYPQYYWTNTVDMDFIGRFESFEDDFRTVDAILGKDITDIPKLNSTDHKPYQEYYCKESKELVEKYYEKDFEVFGYER